MAIFRRGPGPYALHLSMSGIKMGDQFLQLGCGDGELFAAHAAKVGLTGRACAFDRDETAAAKARSAAAKAGVLVEVEVGPFGMLPYQNNSFDLILVRDLLANLRPEQRVDCLQEAKRVLKPGGRCVVVEPAPRGGLGALIGRKGKDPYYAAIGGAERALQAEGFRAVRKLAERDGVAFFEGMKPR